MILFSASSPTDGLVRVMACSAVLTRWVGSLMKCLADISLFYWPKGRKWASNALYKCAMARSLGEWDCQADPGTKMGSVGMGCDTGCPEQLVGERLVYLWSKSTLDV